MEILFAGYAAMFAVLNIAAGRRFFGITNSTQLGRVLFASGGATLATFFVGGDVWLFVGVAIGLFLWRLPSWGEFFAAIHGREGIHESSIFSNLSHKIWPIIPSNDIERKLKATLAMSLRMSLIIPVVVFYHVYIGNYYGILYALAFPLMGIAYFAGGVPREHKYSVAVAEAFCGVVIAAMLWFY